jgi:hypothetical protein
MLVAVDDRSKVGTNHKVSLCSRVLGEPQEDDGCDITHRDDQRHNGSDECHQDYSSPKALRLLRERG